MYCHCGNIVENKDTGECASCGNARRKADRMKVKEKKPIRKVSIKLQGKLKEYSVKRKKHLKKHPFCQIKLIGCEIKAVDIHHTKPRATALNDELLFMSACRYCHKTIHDVMSAAERRDKGLLK